MGKSFLTIQAGRLVRYLMNRSVCEVPQEDLKSSAVVFAPHPDDETLGCGGTLIRKIQAGARVHVVFMTDGAGSHNKAITPGMLKIIRKNEALSATSVLGVESGHVAFLNFPDGKLYYQAVNVEEQVEEILRRLKPEQVFIPCFHECVLDHVAVNKIVLAALENCGQQPMVYEYPIWFWDHWPWVSRTMRVGRQMLRRMKISLSANYQMNMRKRFRSSVFVGDVLKVKRRALDEYRSQMTQLVPGVPWPTLEDVGKGDFLKCFFQERELFYRYRVMPSPNEM